MNNVKKYRLKKRFYFPDGYIAEPQVLGNLPSSYFAAEASLNGGISKFPLGYTFVQTNTEFFEEIEEVENPVKRTKGEFYFIADKVGGVNKYSYDHSIGSSGLIFCGNYFKTEAQAKEAAFLHSFVNFLLHYNYDAISLIDAMNEVYNAKEHLDEIRNAIKFAELATGYKQEE